MNFCNDLIWFCLNDDWWLKTLNKSNLKSLFFLNVIINHNFHKKEFYVIFFILILEQIIAWNKYCTYNKPIPTCHYCFSKSFWDDHAALYNDIACAQSPSAAYTQKTITHSCSFICKSDYSKKIKINQKSNGSSV